MLIQIARVALWSVVGILAILGVVVVAFGIVMTVVALNTIL